MSQLDLFEPERLGEIGALAMIEAAGVDPDFALLDRTADAGGGWPEYLALFPQLGLRFRGQFIERP